MLFKLLLVFLVTAGSIFGLAKLAPELKLLAEPGEHRAHQSPTPMVGGIGIYLGILLGFVLLDQTFARLMPSLFLLCALGAVDDRYHLPSVIRFIAQGAIAYLTIQQTGVELETIGKLLGSEKVLLGSWSIPVTVFAYIGVINAINMSDGLDGLAASLVVLVLASLFVLGSSDQGLILITIVALLGFLTWNTRVGRPRAKVFMGDAGSTMLGLLLAFLLIVHSQATDSIKPVTALWLCALPLLDAVGVLLIRPLRGRSSFTADRIHYHHQLLDSGLSVNQTLCVAIAIQLLFIVVGIMFWRFDVAERGQFFSFLTVFLIYLMFLWRRTAPQ